MWIRTQDKKQLINVLTVEIDSIYGDKRNKVIVWARFAPDSLFSSNRVALGKYHTMEDAMAEINEIENCILKNPNCVYHMKSNHYE